MKIAEEIITILASGTVDGNTYYLPTGQLDRKTYEAVNKCLTSLGGKWNKKAKGHVFDYDPEEALDELLFTGEVENEKKTFQFFPTPREIGEELANYAEIKSGSAILEPSCGNGALSDVLYDRCANVTGIEINPKMDVYLKDKPYLTMVGVDFLDFAQEVREGKIRRGWDRIVMNPPFAKQQDVDHVLAAWDVLEAGILVSVMSPSPFFRTNKKSVDFMEFLRANNAEIIDVPEGAFKESGTLIRTKIVKLIK